MRPGLISREEDMPRMKTAYPLIVVMALSAALARGTAFATDDPAEALKGPKNRIAEACEKQVKALIQTRCFFTVKEYIDVGLWFMPDGERLRKYEEFYAFVPELYVWDNELRPENLPESRDLRKAKHDRKADSKALHEFFSMSLNVLLCGYVDELSTLKGYDKESFKEAAGKDVLSLHEFLDKQNWVGMYPRKYVQIEAPILETTVKAALAMQEAVFARLAETLKAEDPGRFDPPIRTSILASRDLFKRYMTEMKSGDKVRNSAYAEKEVSVYDSERKCFVTAVETYDAFMRDNLAFGIIGPSLDRLGFSSAPFWLRFGINMHVTMDLLGTADTATIDAPKDADYVQAWSWRNYYNWKQTIKDLEKAGSAPPLKDILLRKDDSETSAVEGMKIYCLFQFLAIQEPDRMRRMFRVAGTEGWSPGQDGEFGALKSVGWSFAEMESAYVKFVIR